MFDPTSEAWRLRLILGDRDPGLPAINEQRTALTHHVPLSLPLALPLPELAHRRNRNPAVIPFSFISC